MRCLRFPTHQLTRVTRLIHDAAVNEAAATLSRLGLCTAFLSSPRPASRALGTEHAVKLPSGCQPRPSSGGAAPVRSTAPLPPKVLYTPIILIWQSLILELAIGLLPLKSGRAANAFRFPRLAFFRSELFLEGRGSEQTFKAKIEKRDRIWWSGRRIVDVAAHIGAGERGEKPQKYGGHAFHPEVSASHGEVRRRGAAPTKPAWAPHPETGYLLQSCQRHHLKQMCHERQGSVGASSFAVPFLR